MVEEIRGKAQSHGDRATRGLSVAPARAQGPREVRDSETANVHRRRVEISAVLLVLARCNASWLDLAEVERNRQKNSVSLKPRAWERVSTRGDLCLFLHPNFLLMPMHMHPPQALRLSNPSSPFKRKLHPRTCSGVRSVSVSPASHSSPSFHRQFPSHSQTQHLRSIHTITPRAALAPTTPSQNSISSPLLRSTSATIASQRSQAIARHLATAPPLPSTTMSYSKQPSEYQPRRIGALHTNDFRCFIEKDGVPVSPFHDIPLYANEQQTILNMVVEIPRWSNAKLEVCARSERHRQERFELTFCRSPKKNSCMPPGVPTTRAEHNV